jgi:hypothetical protein
LQRPRHAVVRFSATDFNSSEWEIMYPHFIEEGLIDPSDRVIKKNV